MAGGSQSRILLASNGQKYVVKFKSNPQGQRSLINEVVVSLCAMQLGIAVPKVALINLSSHFLDAHPTLAISQAHHSVPVASGLHFGSQYEPTEAIYDFFPSALLDRIDNLDHFAGALVLDTWTASADYRQAIFTRRRNPANRDLHFHAEMIDHGMAFGGHRWEFRDAPLAGLHLDHGVYRRFTSLSDYEPWIARVDLIGEASFQNVGRSIPEEWLNSDRAELDRLFERLLSRKKMLPFLVEGKLREVARGRGVIELS
jgi:hypothetical protein